VVTEFSPLGACAGRQRVISGRTCGCRPITANPLFECRVVEAALVLEDPGKCHMLLTQQQQQPIVKAQNHNGRRCG
jgi:hypothetical protein